MYVLIYFYFVENINLLYYIMIINLVIFLLEYFVFFFNFIYKRKRYFEGNLLFFFLRSEKDGNILV